MSQPPRWAPAPKLKRGLYVTGLCLLCLIIGQMFMLIGYGLMIVPDEYPGGSGGVPGRGVESPHSILFFALLDLGLGLVSSVLLLPFALRRVPERRIFEHPDQKVQTYKEPVSALVVTLFMIMISGFSGASFWATALAIISVCSRGVRRWLYWIPPVAILSSLAAYIFGPRIAGGQIMEVIIVNGFWWAMVGLFMAIGLLRWSRRRQMRAWRSEAAMARREAQAIIQAEQARAQKARAEERTRIAREMHDTLSHRLALISTYAGALDYRQDLDPATVRLTAKLVQETASTASAELRTVLDILRDDPEDTRPEPDLSDLEELMDEVRSAGVRVRSTVQGQDLATLPATLSRTLYRIVQEALTNVVKHAPGSLATIHWRGAQDRIELTVTNPVTASEHKDSVVTVGGFGLIGVDERAKTLGGSSTVTRTSDVFHLEVSIPWQS